MSVRRRIALGLMVVLLPIALFLVVNTTNGGDRPDQAGRYFGCC